MSVAGLHLFHGPVSVLMVSFNIVLKKLIAEFWKHHYEGFRQHKKNEINLQVSETNIDILIGRFFPGGVVATIFLDLSNYCVHCYPKPKKAKTPKIKPKL